MLSRYYLCLISLILVLTCGVVNAAEVSYSVGKATKLTRISHVDPGETYAMQEIAIRLDSNFEFSLVNHEYFIRGIDDFDCISFGIIYHWTWNYKWLFADLGLGFRYAEKNRDIKWLMHKHLLADFSGSVGVKYKCLKLGYTLRHFSAPGSDTGMNLDQVTITMEVPF